MLSYNHLKTTIIYYRTSSGREPVREYLHGLMPRDQANIAFDLELIEKLGPQAAQVRTRNINGKLWEIKTGARRQQRVFYCLITGPAIVLLHACKKQKTGSQPQDVELAYKRLKEILP